MEQAVAVALHLDDGKRGWNLASCTAREPAWAFGRRFGVRGNANAKLWARSLGFCLVPLISCLRDASDVKAKSEYTEGAHFFPHAVTQASAMLSAAVVPEAIAIAGPARGQHGAGGGCYFLQIWGGPVRNIIQAPDLKARRGSGSGLEKSN